MHGDGRIQAVANGQKRSLLKHSLVVGAASLLTCIKSGFLLAQKTTMLKYHELSRFITKRSVVVFFPTGRLSSLLTEVRSTNMTKQNNDKANAHNRNPGTNGTNKTWDKNHGHTGWQKNPENPLNQVKKS